MDKVILEGSPDIVVSLRRNARAKRISLRVSQLDGRVTTTAPGWTPLREIEQFVRAKENWIRLNLSEQLDAVTPSIGGTILFQGEHTAILSTRGRSVRFDGRSLLVPGNPDRAPARLAGFLKTLARQRLANACDVFSARSGQAYSRITLRDTRSRWGSCTSNGNLMFSWRLVMAPSPVLDYVAAHEVAHLSEMNHSPAYWKVVETIYPNYAGPRGWLRTNGKHLHAYRFGN